MRANFLLKVGFFVVTILAFISIRIFIYFFGQKQIQSFLLNVEKKDFESLVSSTASENFNLELPLSLKLTGDYANFLKKLKSTTKFTDLKLYGPDEEIVFSSNPEEIGQTIASNNFIRDAIGGATNVDKINVEKNQAVIYAPVKAANGTVRGAVSATVSLSGSLKDIRNLVIKLDLIIGLVSILFVMIILSMYSSAKQDLLEKDRSIVDQSKALEEEQQLDEAIISSIAESLAVINKDGQIMLFNPEAEKLTGYRSSEVEYRLYRKILDFVDKEGKPRENPITNILKTGAPISITLKDGYYLKNQKKELVPIALKAAPILDNKKVVTGVAVTIQNISSDLELSKVKDEFVYVVAHELGNPIFALDGYLSILQDNQKKFDNNSKEIIGSARAVNRQLSELVNDLLEVVRTEQGTLQCDIQKVELSFIAHDVIKTANFRAKSKGVTLSYRQDKKVFVMANEQKIKEVLTNLVDNAIKYNKEGGKVTVHHDVENDEIVTCVQDNGLGISQEDQARLFEKFYRIQTKDTRNISGTGLGLFICRQIVEKCGGKIWAESEEGKGSTFCFSLKKAK